MIQLFRDKSCDNQLDIHSSVTCQRYAWLILKGLYINCGFHSC